MTISRRSFAGLSVAAASGTLLSSGPAIAAEPEAGDSAATSTAKPGGLTVPEHFVPTPKTISPQAQAFLEATAKRGWSQPTPPLDDLEGWKKSREAGDAGIIMMTKRHAERFPNKQTTHELSHSKLYEVETENIAKGNADRVIVYVHGGGYVAGGGLAAVYPAIQMAGLAKTRVYSVDYRLAPENPYPAAMDDTLEAYRFILKRHKPKKIALWGGSAGANLVPSMILRARDEGLPLPAALALHSCPSDRARVGDSLYTHFMVDTVLKQRSEGLDKAYLPGDHDPKDPYVSPVYGDFSKGFPPTLLTSGTRDLLLSPTVMMHRALQKGGVKAELQVWEAMTHAPFIGAPEEEELYMEHINFMLSHMA
jgi:monoterpene epsilon-lactone hydrolase